MTRGLHTHRFRDNPEEQRFAEAWAQFAENNLGWLLCTGRQEGARPPVGIRDEVVAATVIQWLGTPVGQGFLRDLGYERAGK